ncbi:hypothetical protein [Mucilaginibacter auburnensis]|nr:hypothetical protein [Mucilaginibacter auburnensis]
MKTALKILRLAIAILAIIFVHLLFFIHHPPEVQLAFLTPGVTLVGYSLIRDELYVRPTARMLRER